MLGIRCKEKYEPPVIHQDLSYLIIDGYLNNGTDSTFIRLSRTKKLEQNPAIGGEANAQMTIEDVQGNTLYNFVQVNDNGVYAVPSISLAASQTYKLRINTSDGQQYVSDDIPVKETPPIDSISWQANAEGVTIYANTHDQQNNTKYYRWEYSETWDFHVNYYSSLKYQDGIGFSMRTPEELIYHCWRTNASPVLLLGSSVKLAQDIISLQPLRFIARNLSEIGSVYSILVKQYALTREAFEYIENLKKISEQTGSLFDAQPSEITGNIHHVGNPEEPVIGFITASSTQQQRIFIRNEQVEPWNTYKDCPPIIKVPVGDADSIQRCFGGVIPLFIPLNEVTEYGTSFILGGIPTCTDCTLKGTTTKPDFWP